MWFKKQIGSKKNPIPKPITITEPIVLDDSVPENVDSPDKENQSSVENRLVPDEATGNPTRNDQISPDLEKTANVHGIKRRRKSKINVSSTAITSEEIKSTDDKKNQTNVQGSKRRKKSQMNASKKPKINTSIVELSSSE